MTPMTADLDSAQERKTDLPRSLEPHDLFTMVQSDFLLVLAPAFAPLEPYEEEGADSKGKRVPFCGRAVPRID